MSSFDKVPEFTVIFENKYKFAFILEVHKIFQTFGRHLTILGVTLFKKSSFLMRF